MTERRPRSSSILFAVLCAAVFSIALPLASGKARAVTVEDGTDKAIGAENTRTVLALIEQHLNNPDAKVTVLRRSGPSLICGSVNVKNKEGLYTGERGFVVDLSDNSFGRVPDGPELLSSRSAGFDTKERIRQIYFEKCLD